MKKRLALGLASLLAISFPLNAAPKKFGDTYTDLKDPNLPANFKFKANMQVKVWEHK